MKNTILNTDKRLFLITFLHKTTDKKFITGQDVGFMKVLKEFDKTGIESIKVFSPFKNRFERISKGQIRTFFSWCTEVDLYLEKHYYFN